MTGQSGMPARRMAITRALGLGALGGVSLLATPSAEAALGDPTIPTTPGTKFYLRVDAIQGDSIDVGFVNQIHLLTWGCRSLHASCSRAVKAGGSPFTYLRIEFDEATRRRAAGR